MNPWWKIGIILGWTLFSGFIGWHVRDWKDQAAAAKKTEIEQAQIIGAEKSVILKERADNQATNEVSHAYQSRITNLDNLYADALAGLHTDTAGTAAGGVSRLPDGQSGYNGGTCPNRFSQRNEKALIALVKQADVQTARLIACQGWIKAHQPKPSQ